MKNSNNQKPITPSQATPVKPNELEQALEMVRRARSAQAAQSKKEIHETYGNTYVIPEPIVFRVTESS